MIFSFGSHFLSSSRYFFSRSSSSSFNQSSSIIFLRTSSSYPDVLRLRKMFLIVLADFIEIILALSSLYVWLDGSFESIRLIICSFSNHLRVSLSMMFFLLFHFSRRLHTKEYRIPSSFMYSSTSLRTLKESSLSEDLSSSFSRSLFLEGMYLK